MLFISNHKPVHQPIHVGPWDHRQRKKGSHLPDFRLWESLEVLWQNNCLKPAWVDAQLAGMDMQTGSGTHVAKPRRSQKGLTAERVRELCQQGQLTDAVEALGVLVQIECCGCQSVWYTVLKTCGAQKDLVLGRRVHALMVKGGYESDTFLCNHILRMYASHASLEEAMDVFSVAAKPDAFMWSSIIYAHVKQGQDKQAIQLYHQMRRSRVKADGHVFVAALQACARGADLETGQQVHADVLASGVEPHLFVSSCLVDMYAKCGSLQDAQRVFDGLGQKNVVTWTALIAGYSQQGMGQEALHLYSAMQNELTVTPTSVTFVALLQACACVGAQALEKGRQLHEQIHEQGLQGDVFVSSSLVNMFAKCGSLEEARGVFDRLLQKNVVTWNSMLVGYSHRGMGLEALHLYSDMQKDVTVVPDSVTFVALLQACASVGTSALDKGRQLHAQIREQGLEADLAVGGSLVNMYAKCGSLEAAQTVFDGLDQKNVVTWTALIAGYAKCGNLEGAQRVFDRVGEKNVVTWTALMAGYAKCGSLEDAQGVFEGLPLKDVVMWNAMIAGYSQQGMGQESLRLYRAMQEEGITAPDSVTFVSLLQACASVGASALVTGKQLHAQIRERQLQADVPVANSLVDMYAKCGSLEDARAVFDRLGHKNVVTWNAMIAGYAQQGVGQEALHLYRSMREEGTAIPDAVTFVSVLQACANVAALHVGRQLHVQIKDQGLQTDGIVGNSLINMYAKSGSMVDAQQVFEALPERDRVAWNALIAGYARQGDSDVVFDLFHRMTEHAIQPASITFLNLLTVCSHSGLVDKGREYFETMSKHYGITPSVEHCTCMVDLLGRSGQLDEALALVKAMSVLPDAAVWHTLLGACRKWGNVEVARHAFHEAVQLNIKDATAYVLMSNVYDGAHMWEQAQEMQTRRKELRAWKQPGQSWWTDMDGFVHTFLVGDTKHPESERICARLKELVARMSGSATEDR